MKYRIKKVVYNDVEKYYVQKKVFWWWENLPMSDWWGGMFIITMYNPLVKKL